MVVMMYRKFLSRAWTSKDSAIHKWIFFPLAFTFQQIEAAEVRKGPLLQWMMHFPKLTIESLIKKTFPRKYVNYFNFENLFKGEFLTFHYRFLPHFYPYEFWNSGTFASLWFYSVSSLKHRFCIGMDAKLFSFNFLSTGFTCQPLGSNTTNPRLQHWCEPKASHFRPNSAWIGRCGSLPRQTCKHTFLHNW